ncbi:MAG TPA: hypothetical protein VMH83_15125 [Candidatus Acidoferrum sp.]|nr:hypothetical protein [Candidatus Acidoferrum sp.]
MKTLQTAVPLLLLVVLAACSKSDPRTAAFAKLPDWRGIWIEENSTAGISGFNADFGKPDAKPRALLDPSAAWTDEGRRRMAAMFATQANRKSQGWGYPMMMTSPAPLQFLVTPEETLIVNIYQEVRHVYTDGRDHPKEEDRWLTTWGDSVGHWDGDTLVIDTVSVREPIKFFQMVPPFSDQAHYVERLRKTGPDRIETEITVEDPVTLAKPLVAKAVYVRTPNLDRLVHDAFVNDRDEIDGGAITIAPPKE